MARTSKKKRWKGQEEIPSQSEDLPDTTWQHGDMRLSCLQDLLDLNYYSFK